MARARIAHCHLYGFVDTAYMRGRDPREVTRQLVAGGVDLIQVRAKDYTHEQRVELGLAVVAEAYPHQVPVIINDDVAAALEIGADGVHLGQEDWAAIPPDERPNTLASVRIVGLSTHSLAQAQAAEQAGVDYIGVGPVFATGTKPGVAPVGLALVRAVSAQVQVPFFAIGGITLANLDQVKTAGATRVAVVSAILNAKNIIAAAAEFKRHL